MGGHNKSNKIGQRYGKLVVLDFTEARDILQKRAFYLCQCDCGNQTVVSSNNLQPRRGTRSCGCTSGPDPKYESSIKRVYSGYKSSAKKRKISFNISFDDFVKLTKLSCSYCGADPSNRFGLVTYNPFEFVYNGLDRVDSSIGYELDNVVTACKMCNYAKRDFSKEDFLVWIERIYKCQFLNG